jgi:7-cyano-7-deazaguanine synthase
MTKTTNAKKAVVLISGGLDSATTLAIALSEGYECHCMSFSYGQRHRNELDAAKNIIHAYPIRHHLIINSDLGILGGSALTDDIRVPKQRTLSEMESGIPLTYVPARNTVFLSYALAWAEVIAAQDIFIGVNAIDYSGYPDCRPEYIQAFEKMANLAIKAAVEGKTIIRIRTPLIQMTKGDIIRTGINLGVDYSITQSCYDPAPGGLACGQCDSCILRLKGFKEAGIPDPAKYKAI